MVFKKRFIMYIVSMSAAIIFVGIIRRRQKKEISYRRKKKKEGSINIGGIFGMDIGGTLSKLVYFERKPGGPDGTWGKRGKSFQQFNSPEHQEALTEIYKVMLSQSILGTTGVRDDSLSFYSTFLGGRFHFIHFESRQMPAAIQNLSSTEITANIKSIGCTGGGAHKYAQMINDLLEIRVLQFDELKCLIRGMHFVMMNYEQECYTYRYDDDGEDGKDASWRRDAKDYCRKVHIPYTEIHNDIKGDMFPYLVVSIGSGVSIMKVTAPGDFERVSGTSIGGGTYWGLCRLFTRCSSFEQVLELAEVGNNAEVDMLVSDIYGGNYDQMNLKGSMVASNFGKLVTEENPREGLQEADLAISLLMMITNNIGQVSYLNAILHNCKKIFFVGNFLRNNQISCRRLAFAISFWSKGTMEAMFLEHEGHFGALGAFLESAFGETVDDVINVSSAKPYADLTNMAKSKPNSRTRTKSIREFFDREGAALHFVSSPGNSPLANSECGKNKFNSPSATRGRHRTVSMTSYPDSSSPRSRHGISRFSGEFRSIRNLNRDTDSVDDQVLSLSRDTSVDGFSPPRMARKRTQSLDSYANTDMEDDLFFGGDSMLSPREEKEKIGDHSKE